MGLDELPDMLRVEEAATVLRIGRSAAYEAVAVFQATGGAEGIPAIRIGRSVRVPKRALLRWIEAQLGAAACRGFQRCRLTGLWWSRRRLARGGECCRPRRGWCSRSWPSARRTIAVLSTNVRQLGAGLGLSKDTVARALRVLIRAGLVVRVDERDASSGRFGAVVYRVDRAAAGLMVTGPLPTPSAVPSGSRPPATRVAFIDVRPDRLHRLRASGSSTSSTVDVMRPIVPVEQPKQEDTLALGVRGSVAVLLGGVRRSAVLSIGVLLPGRAEYYLGTVANGVEDYYTGAGEAPGQWCGTSAGRLGLVGEVEADALHRVLEHADPVTGERLTTGHAVAKVIGFDTTFCPPKSVSLLFGLGDPGGLQRGPQRPRRRGHPSSGGV